ncbi:hypothetical protein BKM17_27355 [Pseudomonas syringae group genomosp. 3]|nr:hypothetical protein BKM17_27355 [Pseudomonas syringae group genomosp. 3]
MKNDPEVYPGDEDWASIGAGSQRKRSVKPADSLRCEIPSPLTAAEFQEMMRQFDEAGNWMLKQLHLKRRGKLKGAD